MAIFSIIIVNSKIYDLYKNGASPCSYVRIDVRIDVYLDARTHDYTHAYTHADAHVCTRAYTHAEAHVHLLSMHVWMHTHVSGQMCMHTPKIAGLMYLLHGVPVTRCGA